MNAVRRARASARGGLLRFAMLGFVSIAGAPGVCAAAEEAPVDGGQRTASAAMPVEAGVSAAASAARTGSVAIYRALVEAEARRAGMPGEVAEAVMAVESGYDPRAIGSVGEIGLMQVLPSTARMLGFVGAADALAAPETNIHYGVAYLARAWRLAGGDLCTAVMKYRAGHGETRFSYRSVDYCLAVRAKLAARGFHVAGNVPGATFGDSPRASIRSALDMRCRRNCLAGSDHARLDFGAINAQLDQLAIQAGANAVRLR